MRIVKRIENRKNHSILSLRRKRYNEIINFYSDISREIEQIENKLARVKKMIKSYSVAGGQKYPYTIDKLAPDGKPNLEEIKNFIKYMLTVPSKQELGTREQFLDSIKSKISEFMNKISRISNKVGSFFKNLIFGKLDEKTQEIAKAYNRRNRKFVYYSDESNVDTSSADISNLKLDQKAVEELLKFGEQVVIDGGIIPNVPKNFNRTKFYKYRKISRFYSSEEDNLEKRINEVNEKLNKMIIKLQQVRILVWKYAFHIPIAGAIISAGIFLATLGYYAYLFFTVKAVLTSAMKALFAKIIIISIICFVVFLLLTFIVVPWIVDRKSEKRINEVVEKAQSIAEQAYEQVEQNPEKADKTLEQLGSVFTKYTDRIKEEIIEKYSGRFTAPSEVFEKIANEMLTEAQSVVGI